jgi:hypothetical protein
MAEVREFINMQGYDITKQIPTPYDTYDKLRTFINANINDYDKFEKGIKNFLCKYIKPQQIFGIYRLFPTDEYKRLKVIECIKFLECTDQLEGIKLIITCHDLKTFTFFTDRKIIVKEK